MRRSRNPKNTTRDPLLEVMARASVPRLLIVHRQRGCNYDRRRFESLVCAALPLCAAVTGRFDNSLNSLDLIEVSVVSKQVMARIHHQFFDLQGATDVITFPYGEILVCASVAASRAKDFGNSVANELALYVIHGLLHLAGHDDLEPIAAKCMAREQERILRAAIAQVC